MTQHLFFIELVKRIFYLNLKLTIHIHYFTIELRLLSEENLEFLIESNSDKQNRKFIYLLNTILYEKLHGDPQ